MTAAASAREADPGAAATPDHAPASGARRLAGLRLTRRGVAVLVCAAALLSFGSWASYPGLVGLGSALAVALVAAVVGVAVPVPLTVRRRVRPLRVARLDDCAATVSVRNTSTWLPVTASGHDLVGGAELPFDVPRLPPGATETTDLPIPTQRRGEIAFGPLVLHRYALADLAEVRQTYGERAVVVVEPRVLDALSLPAGTRRGHVGADERIAHGGTDLVGLREYLPGDDLRRLHWATSARRGSLMVREDADPSAPHLTVLLDDRASSYDGDDFEEAVDVAASLLATASLDRSPSRVVSFSGDLDVTTTSPPAAVATGLDPELLGRLATVTTTTDDGAGAHRFSGSPDIVVLVTGSRAELPPLLADAATAPVGVVAVVDAEPEALVSASRGVTVLRGPRAEELVHAWRSAVAR